MTREEKGLSLQAIQQSLEIRMPKIVLQGVDTFSSVKDSLVSAYTYMCVQKIM
jgi:hypothetical protein